MFTLIYAVVGVFTASELSKTANLIVCVAISFFWPLHHLLIVYYYTREYYDSKIR